MQGVVHLQVDRDDDVLQLLEVLLEVVPAARARGVALRVSVPVHECTNEST